jgi:hypothetical protein
MATQPKALAEEQANPPGVTDNGAMPQEREHEEEAVAEPEQEPETPAAPEEGEPKAEEEPAPEPESEEFEPDPQFAAKFKDDKGRIDWKKAHDAYLNLEKKMGSVQHKEVVPNDDVEKLRQEAQIGRAAAYLAQKYPTLPLQQAHEREMQEQARLRQPQATGPVEIEELPDEEVERRVEELISQGKSAKAQIFAARHTPEARSVRARERESVVEQQRKEQEVVAKAREANRQQLDAIKARDGEIAEEVLEEMRVTLSKTPPSFEVDLDALYQLAKSRVGKKPKAKQPPQPPGRQPARGSAAPTRGNPKPGTDEEFLRSKRELTFEEVLEAQRKKK